VRPGDALAARVSIIEARRSRSKPDRGIIRSHIEVLNQHRDPVLTLTATNLIRTHFPQ
jgi:acyl dehydratase